MVGKLEGDALIEEYKTLRAEIAQRVQSQFIITGANLAFFSGVLVKLPDWADADHLNLLLALPLVTPILTWLYYEQDVFVAQAAQYLNEKLRPAVIKRVASETQESAADLMNWEDFRHRLLFHDPRNSRFMWKLVGFRLIANIGPGLGLLALGAWIMGHTALGAGAVTGLHRFLLVFDIAAIAFAARQYLSVHGRYLRIAAKSP